MRVSKRPLQLLPAVLAASVLAVAAYGYTASNTVPEANAGQGSQTVSGYTVSDVAYTVVEVTGVARITAVTFSLDPDGSNPEVTSITGSNTTVSARVPTSSSTPSYSSCSYALSRWTCTLGSSVAVADAASLDVMAAQNETS